MVASCRQSCPIDWTNFPKRLARPVSACVASRFAPKPLPQTPNHRCLSFTCLSTCAAKHQAPSIEKARRFRPRFIATGSHSSLSRRYPPRPTFQIHRSGSRQRVALSNGRTYQYVLTAEECRLFNHLRKLEDHFKEEYPLIYDGSDSRL